MQDPWLGEIALVAFNFAPQGWAFCNGQLLSIAQNTALFSLLGTTYGGDGKTTFGLPNLQSRVPLHFGQGAGLSTYALGATGGVESVTLQTTQMPAHTHAYAPQATTANGRLAHPMRIWRLRLSAIPAAAKGMKTASPF
jgi:microcystin-dependent protein